VALCGWALMVGVAVFTKPAAFTVTVAGFLLAMSLFQI
jgi:hypothetical protein